ncbi:MAG: IS110 family transposase [Caulobacteraceae bacterium]|nr:IS110 family transposase [Caulobacteraceae bacterium]
MSQRRTAICIVDGEGAMVAEGSALTSPAEIHLWIVKHIDVALVQRVGLEAGPMSFWLHSELAAMELPVICLEAFQAAQLLKVQRNKTDRNDARGLAQIVRLGGHFLRSVAIRRSSSQELRALLTLRQYLVSQKVGLQNNITGVLKQFGLVVRRGKLSAETFREGVLMTLSAAHERGVFLREMIGPALALLDGIVEQLAVLTRQVQEAARADAVCRRLMTVPGVGPIVALSYMTAVDDPQRFARASDVGAYFGLTPRQYQSGEIDIRGNASRRGDIMTRCHLIQAATVLLASTKKWSTLRAWGMRVAKKSGMGKARIAVARKLSTILWLMWVREQDFCWSTGSDDPPTLATAA